MRPEFASQRGFGLVAVLFLILVIAGVIAAMARLSVTQHSTASLATQQVRAYQAARAGLEWGIYRAAVDSACSASTSFTLNGMEVAVHCVPSDFYELEASAQWGQPGSPDHVYRRLEAVLEK